MMRHYVLGFFYDAASPRAPTLTITPVIAVYIRKHNRHAVPPLLQDHAEKRINRRVLA